MFLSSCDRYEFIDKNTRFNKRTGETEIMYSDGKWMTKSERIKYNKRLNKIENEKRQSKLQPFPFSERSKITGRGGFKDIGIYDLTNFRSTIENNSDWKIEEVDIQVNIYSKSDSVLLTTRKFTGKSYGENEGTPFSKFEYKGTIPEKLDNQYNTWTIIQVRGFKY